MDEPLVQNESNKFSKSQRYTLICILMACFASYATIALIGPVGFQNVELQIGHFDFQMKI